MIPNEPEGPEASKRLGDELKRLDEHEWRQNRLVLCIPNHRGSKEGSRGGHAAVCAEQGIDRFAKLVHCPIQISNAAPNRNCRLIHPP
jgi:hypothetical protein